MKKTKEPAFVAKTLAWCNAMRKEKGLEPLDKLPKGEIGDGASCPCGNATGLWVGVLGYFRDENSAASSGRDYDGPVPRCVTNFVAAFDTHKLPQYIA